MQEIGSDNRRMRVISLRVDVCNHESVIQNAAELIRGKRGGYIWFSTVHMTMESYDDLDFAAKVDAADLVIPLRAKP